MVVEQAAPSVGEWLDRLRVASDEVDDGLLVAYVRAMQSAHSTLGEKQGVMDAVLKLHPIAKVNTSVAQIPIPAHVARIGPYGYALTQQGDTVALQGCRFRGKIEAYTVFLSHGRSLFNRRSCQAKV